MTPLPTGTVTFLFTDIEGSTRMLRDVGQVVYAGALAQHHALMREAIASAGGVEVGTEGDSFFVAFGGAGAAIAAVVSAQRALQGQAWPPGAEIRVRMGLHTGEGVLSDGDYVGMDVHRAARVASAGHGGQVLLSEATATAVSGTLPAGVELEDLGSHRLKDLGAARLFQLRVAGLRVDFSPLATQEAIEVELPAQLTTFIGREREMAEITLLLETTPLVTLTGPGGTGKSRLAVEAASRLLDRFEDGVFFVALAGLSDPELVPVTILEVLGLRSNSAAISPLDHLLSFLNEKRVLLILDNYEQLVAGGSTVADILTASPALRVIVTSRAPLRVSGEREVAVLPLGVSDGQGDGTSESVRLFLDRARSIRPDLELSAEDDDAIAQITRRLEGLPLAIELAASRSNVLTPVEILQRLGNRLLAAPSSDLPSRQRTIADTIAWSYDLLDGPAQRLFERCAVFVNGAGLAEIEEVCLGPDEVGDDLLDGLSALVDHSLMQRRSTPQGLRFGMLSVIREFAMQKLEEGGEADVYRGRHAATYRALVERARPLLVSGARPHWLDRMAAEDDNIRAVLDRAIARRDAEAALALVGGMWRFWQTRGPLAEARDRVQEALALGGQEYPKVRAQALAAAGGIAYWSGALDEMEVPYQEAVDIARGQGGAIELAAALYELSFAFYAQNGYDRADAVLAESMALAEAADDAYSIARAHFGLFNLAWYQSRTDEALAHSRASVAAFKGVDAPFDLGWSEFAVADSLMRKGDRAEARETLDRALPDFVASGDLSALILFLNTYAALAALQESPARAARLAGAAESLEEQTGVKLYASDAWGVPNKATRELLGQLDARSTAEYQGGRRMSAEAAARFALGHDDE
jgi:predicted ATPase/class 3 adenylate cyclase